MSPNTPRAVRSLLTFVALRSTVQAEHGRPLAKAGPPPCLSKGGQECPPSVNSLRLLAIFARVPSSPIAI